MARERRTFSDVDVSSLRDPMPLGLGLFGYTTTGKTWSALRVATGIQRIFGGEVFLADSDGKRGQHYKNYFNYRYIPFPGPHNAHDYIDLLEEYEKRKGVLIVDQFTEEHEGEQGLIETQQRVSGGNKKKNAAGWAVAKNEHKKLARVVRRVMASIPLLCLWRAADKLDWKTGGEPQPLGEMPIGSRDLPFEMTMNLLLPLGARGRPLLTPDKPGEYMMTKIPEQFIGLVQQGEQLSEWHGETMARWAMGETIQSAATPKMSNAACAMLERLNAINTGLEIREIKPDLEREFPRTHQDHAALSKAFGEAVERARANAKRPVEPSSSEHQSESSAPTGSE